MRSKWFLYPGYSPATRVGKLYEKLCKSKVSRLFSTHPVRSLFEIVDVTLDEIYALYFRVRYGVDLKDRVAIKEAVITVANIRERAVDEANQARIQREQEATEVKFKCSKN